MKSYHGSFNSYQSFKCLKNQRPIFLSMIAIDRYQS
jgi:hypothetical protein